MTNGIVACSLTVIWILVYQPFGSPLCFDFQAKSYSLKRRTSNYGHVSHETSVTNYKDYEVIDSSLGTAKSA